MGYLINLLTFEFLLILKRSVFLKAYVFSLITILFVNKFYFNIYIISYLFLISFFFLLKIYKEDMNIRLFYIVHNISLCLVHKIKIILLYLLFLISFTVRLFVIQGNLNEHFVSLLAFTNAASFIGIFCNITKNYLKILLFVIYFIAVSIINYLLGYYLSVLFFLIVVLIFVKGLLQYGRTNTI